jgi:hypothetical protein
MDITFDLGRMLYNDNGNGFVGEPRPNGNLGIPAVAMGFEGSEDRGWAAIKGSSTSRKTRYVE